MYVIYIKRIIKKNKYSYYYVINVDLKVKLIEVYRFRNKLEINYVFDILMFYYE